MFMFPWTNMHEINLEWLVQQVQAGLIDHGCAFVRPEDYPDAEDPIQTAIYEARDQSKMVLLSGAYHIQDTLTVPAGSIIIGIHDAKLISRPMDAAGFCPTTIMRVPDSMYCCGVTFDGNRPEGDSITVTPSEVPNAEDFYRRPLVLLDGADGVTFEGCAFVNYDSNHSSSGEAWRQAVLAVVDSEDVTIKNCRFTDIRRECVNMLDSSGIVIQECDFDTMGESGVSYTEIGCLNTDDVQIIDTVIRSEPHRRASVINAMGNHILIDHCTIIAPGSSHGIDYGNEIGSAMSFDDLTIRDSFLQCHVDAASTYPVNHDNITIEGCTISGQDIELQSGVIVIQGNLGERFRIKNNLFVGPMGNPTHAIIMSYTSVVLEISGNTFHVPALRLKGTVAGMTVKDNLFQQEAIFQAQAGADPQVLTLIGCRTLADIGRAVSSNNIAVVAIGCDLANTTMTNTTVTSSLSYVRS